MTFWLRDISGFLCGLCVCVHMLILFFLNRFLCGQDSQVSDEIVCERERESVCVCVFHHTFDENAMRNVCVSIACTHYARACVCGDVCVACKLYGCIYMMNK